jgi:filamentous hemagglutinin family protein
MKQGGSRKTVFRPKLLAVSVAACFAVSTSQGYAQVLPTGATGVTGVTGISQAGSTLTVNTSGNSVLNYTSFSIGSGATVQINQASAAYASLQRVIGAGGVIPQSVIDGMLKSNGRVFLLNPSGVVIGAGARIDVAGFVASSLNMSDEDFLGGRMRFTENAAAKAVKNYGEITTASGGHVYLVAPEVENHGIIRAPQGQIILAAGKSAELISDASPYVTVKVVADVQKALNVGQLIADSGKIGIYGALVQHSGVAEASGAVAGPGGEIRFVATKDLTLDAGSRVAANGASGGKVVLQAEGGTNLIGGTVEAKGSAGQGGEVQALGVRVGVVGHGIIDASGEAGGGQVLVGGDFQGKNAAIQNAERTYIGPDGVIRADAGANGDGGRVIVWADGDTRFYGHISARGGSQSGDGGFVETSGKGQLVALGTVNAGAPHGKAGTWLLDPDDITIVSGSGSNDNEIYGDGLLAFGEMPGGYGFSTIGTSGIVGAMMGPYGTNVVLQANNTITLQTDINTAPYAGKSLTLQAGSEIALQFYGITTDGDLTLSAPSITSDGTSSVTLSSLNGFTTLAGTANLGTGINISGKNGVSTGNIIADNYDSHVSISSGYGSISTGSIQTFDGGDGGSMISMNAGYGSISTGNLHSAGSGNGISLSAGGNITTGNLSTKPTQAWFGSMNGGNINVSASGRVVVNGSIDVSGMDGGEGSINGGNAGQAFLSGGSTDAAAVQVTGMILANGGRGGAGFYGGAGYGGNGGSVMAYGFSGGISIGGIQAMGGAGASGAYGDLHGGNGGSVTAYAGGGTLSIGSVQVDGGAGGSAFDGDGGMGGQGGSVSLSGVSVATNFITATGGAGGFSESNEGADGGWGGNINVSSSGSVLIGATSTSGGAGGGSAVDESGSGGDGGITSVSGTSVTVGQMASRGGAGGDGAEGGNGGWGGGVSVNGASVTVGLIDLSGGNAGTSHVDSSGCCGAQSGGGGGFFSINGDNVNVGFIYARGGNGSNWAGGDGGTGGDGGEGSISAVNKLIIGPNPLVGKSQTVIDVSGGAGGNGGPGAGGNGGWGGFVAIDPIEILINGVIAGTGGAGGAGASPGVGGNGGSAYFQTTGGTGNITFVNGGWDMSAGAGGSNGFVSGPGVFPAQLDVAKFIHIGPGDLADIPVESVGIFRFLAVADPLAVATVLQQVGLTQSQPEPESGAGESQEEEKTEREKTGSLGSCRPS